MQPTTPTACLMVLELSFGTKTPANMKPFDHQSTAIWYAIYFTKKIATAYNGAEFLTKKKFGATGFCFTKQPSK